MSVRELFVLYAVVGFACAIAVLKRAPTRTAATFFSALMTIPLWPLWAPFALVPNGENRRPRAESPRSPQREAAVARVERALADAVAAVEGTPMSGVFTHEIASRVSAEVSHVADRLGDLDALVARSEFDREASAKRLADLERSGAEPRAIATARLQLESLERLAQMRAADARALEELADLLEALRTQLVLARYAGSSADGASAIVSEVWARLEGLGAALDPEAT